MKQKHPSHSEEAHGHTPGGSAGHDPAAMIREMRKKWLWTNCTVIALGLWLITSPATFGYRGTAVAWNDVASGALLVLLGAWSLQPHPRADFFGRWGVALVGTWLQVAPLVFWAPSAAAYANETLIERWPSRSRSWSR